MLKLNPTQGIIAACDSAYFNGFQWMSRSAFKWGYSVALVNLGISEEQKRWCRENNVFLIDFDSSLIFRKNAKPVSHPVNRKHEPWQTWNKPIFIEQSPFKHTLYLDCDCYLVRSPKPIFEKIKENFVIVEHWSQDYCRNEKKLNKLHSVKKVFDVGINAGVIGVDKDRDLTSDWFNDWKKMIKLADQSEDVRKLINYYDEGALNWAIESTGRTLEITHYRGWNQPCCVPPLDYFTESEYKLNSLAKVYDIVLHVQNDFVVSM